MKPGYSPKFTVMVDEELFQKIEDYRFEKRFQTRKDAMVDLLEKGLEAVMADLKKSEDKNG